MSHTAWNPGLSSSIPRNLMPFTTLFNSSNAEISYEEAKDISQRSGLRLESLASFKLERMILHEVMVRVIADLTIPEGDSNRDLGANAREMFSVFYDKYVMPNFSSYHRDYEAMHSSVERFVEKELLDRVYDSEDDSSGDPPEVHALHVWMSRISEKSGLKLSSDDEMELGCLEGLISVVNDIVNRRGSLVTNCATTTKIVVNRVCEDYGSKWVNDMISPAFDEGVESEGYRYLPGQESPVILNAKGASASGKTTMRDYQREFSKRLNVEWEDFAFISPDFWRRQLLNYDTLKDEHKRYASLLTGLELAVIERKLDRHMALRAATKRTSHMVIDRFRFDSFGVGQSAGSNLLTRFGDRVYMLYMITSPAATVERAWVRGNQTGRYEPVDELLFHNVEGYKGIADLFFSWTLSGEKKMHFEFLDNNVEEGSPPRTVAFGWNNKMTVLDLKSMVDVDRYRKVDIEATSESELFDEGSMKIDYNLEFVFRAIQEVPDVTFADPATGKIYAKAEKGSVIWCDHKYVEEKSKDSVEFEAIFRRLAYQNIEDRSDGSRINVSNEKLATIGCWDSLGG